MPIINPETGTAHDYATLTDAFRRLPYVPQQINALPWNAQGVATRTLLVDTRTETFDLVDPRAWNSGMSQVDLGDAEDDQSVPLKVLHYPHGFTVRASEVSEQRAFGSESEIETTADRLAREMATWQTSIDFTWEFTRIGAALFGVILGRYGKVYVDLRKTFKRQPLRLKFNFGSGENFFEFLNGAKYLARQRLGGSYNVAGFQLLGDYAMNQKVIYDPSVQNTYAGFQERQFMRADNSKGFTICDEVEVKLYRNQFIPRTNQLAFPTTVLALIPNAPNLFQSRFAPAQVMGGVNTAGAPVYLFPKDLDFNEGVQVKGQTNIISWNQRLEGIVLIEHGPTTDLAALGFYGESASSPFDTLDDLTDADLGLAPGTNIMPRGLTEALSDEQADEVA
ncbi:MULTISPECIES: major capsid protein [unclassified Methylobacterium]|jgi:Phage major capsid protein E|uniref:major capsid protein n=1 Tax=unclassified Methylobacterium TaxID=2615210 RepID=UPI0013538139|nr:major capsid protein [Methylobacterium sp. 2A]MWV22452.1 hypothetical protein [Methylobacterium sp. 2A]